MGGRLREFYAVVKSKPCLACGAPPPSEAAHIAGIASNKVRGQFLPRGHKGMSAFAAIPLCAQCHRLGEDAIHKHKEGGWLDEHIPGGKAYAVAYAFRCLLEALDVS